MMLVFQSLFRGRVFSPQVKIYLNLKSNFIMDKAKSFNFFASDQKFQVYYSFYEGEKPRNHEGKGVRPKQLIGVECKFNTSAMVRDDVL